MVLCWPIKQNIKKIHIKELKEQTEQSERTDGMTHRNEKENVSRYWNTAIVIKTESHISTLQHADTHRHTVSATFVALLQTSLVHIIFISHESIKCLLSIQIDTVISNQLKECFFITIITINTILTKIIQSTR